MAGPIPFLWKVAQGPSGGGRKGTPSLPQSSIQSANPKGLSSPWPCPSLGALTDGRGPCLSVSCKMVLKETPMGGYPKPLPPQLWLPVDRGVGTSFSFYVHQTPSPTCRCHMDPHSHPRPRACLPPATSTASCCNVSPQQRPARPAGTCRPPLSLLGAARLRSSGACVQPGARAGGTSVSFPRPRARSSSPLLSELQTAGRGAEARAPGQQGANFSVVLSDPV